jgi:hypothetical protein
MHFLPHIAPMLPRRYFLWKSYGVLTFAKKYAILGNITVNKLFFIQKIIGCNFEALQTVFDRFILTYPYFR